MNGAHKKTLLSAWCVGAGPKAFLARQVPTSGRRRMVAKTDGRGWAARLKCDVHDIHDG